MIAVILVSEFFYHDMISACVVFMVFFSLEHVSVECEERIPCLGRQFRFAPWENCVECMDSSQQAGLNSGTVFCQRVWIS